jgi:hypothetical protein
MKKLSYTSSLLSFAVLAISQAMQPAYAATSLVYVPVNPPCRISNTRETPSFSIPADSGIDLLAYGDATNLAPQGGKQDCLNPIPASTPVAIAANVTAVGNKASGNGNLVAYPVGGAVPATSLLNYTPSGNIANSTIIALCEGSSCSADLTVFSNGSSVPVIVDVQGYFYPKTLKNVITVSLENGDFTSPVDAIDSIPTEGADAPRATNPYVINVGPGVYALGSTDLVMRSFVSVIGAGVDATTISGTAPVQIRLENVLGAELASMTVLDNGDGQSNITAVFIDADSDSASNPHLYDLRIIAEGAANNTTGLQIGTNADVSGTLVPLIERVDVVALDAPSGGLVGVNIRVCGNTRLLRVNAYGARGLVLGGDADCVNPILWSQFSGADDTDVFANIAANATIGQSHLVNGTIAFGGGAGVINCVSVTTPTAILNPDCSAP